MVVIERKDENERFYGKRTLAVELMKGMARRLSSTDGLIAMIEMVEEKRMREDSIPTGPLPLEQAGLVQLPMPEPLQIPRRHSPIASSSHIPEPESVLSWSMWSTLAVAE